MSIQFELTLPQYRRGIHLITDIIENSLKDRAVTETGLLSIFVKHTSAGICINENADPSVRTDLTNFLNALAPDNSKLYTHTEEGADDMPSHIKTVLVGNSISVPLNRGKMNLGIWQGIYFLENRNKATNRNLVLTVIF